MNTRLILSAALWAFAATSAWAAPSAKPAAAPDVSAITLAPDKTEIAAGENVVIRGTATVPSGSALSLLSSERDKNAVPDKDGKEQEQPFSILKVETGQPIRAGDRDQIPFTITAAAFELGEQTFPVLDWLVTTGGKTQTLKSPPVKFKVAAPQASAPDADINDLKPPIRPFPWPRVWGFLAIVALLAAATAWWAWRDGREREEEGTDMHELPPYEEALERLKQLAESGVWEAGDSKEFFSQLADIERDYFSRRFSFDAKLLTTSALARHLRELEIDPVVSRGVRGFLETCDMVKFAKWIPDAADKDEALARARMLLEATKPAPAPLQSDASLSTDTTLSPPPSPLRRGKKGEGGGQLP